MKTRLLATLITCFIITNALSQTNLNDYKYIIVPKKFDFLKKEDQYRLNSLTKFLFEKYGFTTLLEGENYPDDFKQNRCLGLKSNVIKDSGMFKTKLTVALKDCNDQVVFTSKVGESRIKEYDKSYNEALRNAFKSFENINYSYVPNSKNETTVAKIADEPKKEIAQEIQKLKEEIKTLKKEKEKAVEVVKTQAKEVKPEAKVVVEEKKPIKEIVIEGVSNVLYAQEIADGFQLVDSSPKVVYRIKNTNLNHVFLIENKSAIIYKKGEDWVLEFYKGNTLVQQTLNIKF
ncbi:hypothetical protein L3X37_14500 [Sabulilitoribacter arenilitoris]|uniref:Uncharacterized protein n=1 Tax=Wocania arenilitoris TaxID=2044858 RepID=A0AAE3JPB7_9FLAO|nr:hypothetical protein [Wocania arenilitoris]MCF7569556.1 hypothetical protein [Wocania arenilitoris]